MGWFSSKDEKETKRLIDIVTKLRASSRFQSDDDIRQFVVDLLVEVCEVSDLCLSAIVAGPLFEISLSLLRAEPFCLDPGKLRQPESLRAGVTLREALRNAERILASEDHYLGKWRGTMFALLVGVVSDFPVEALTDPRPDGSVEDTSVLHPVRPLGELVGDLPHMLTSFMGTFCAPDLIEDGLFRETAGRCDERLCAVSGIPWNERFSSKRKILLPIDRKELSAKELSDFYLTGTVFERFFDIEVPIPIPRDLRFEHMHILGGTGHGKTQLLQYLLMDDLHAALSEKRSIVVLDPDGTLIHTISETDYFAWGLLGERAVFIDPSESERPVGLNLFDAQRLDGAEMRTREAVENNTIELFEYFFDALLGSELTGKQATLFRYLGLLLMQIPGGNIHTLRELMEDGRQYKSYMEKLEGSARVFFETRFFSKDLAGTKSQVLSRLWAVLSNRSLDRLLSAKQSTINFDQALQDGKIIFVSTAKEYLGEEGSAIFARMMVAMLGQTLMRRAAIAPDQRTPTYIYIDEAEGVVDQTLIRLLSQTRKYKAAFTLAHQHLDQLSASARSGIFANTSLKLAGGISAKDAATFAQEMRCKADFILSQKKEAGRSHFALYAKNITPSAMTFAVPFGVAEGCGRLTPTEYADLLDWSRDTYGEVAWEGAASEPDDLPSGEVIAPKMPSIVVDAADALSTAPASIPIPEPVFRKEGGGGARHQAICGAIKELGEGAGFRASIEETILDGEGRVDVILRQGKRAIAFEVSVTTSKEHELLNVQKCLQAGFGEVVVVAALPRHLVSLERFVGAALGEGESDKVRFLLADDLGGWFEGEVPERAEKVVRGWRVKSNLKPKTSAKEYFSALDI